MRKNEDRERNQIIIDEIMCGGFTEDELDAIIDACETEKDKL